MVVPSNPDAEHNTVTNTKTSLENDSYEMYFKKCGVHFQKSHLYDASTNNHHQPECSLDDYLALSNNCRLDGMSERNGNDADDHDDRHCDSRSETNVRKAPNTLDLSGTAKKRKYSQTKRSFNSTANSKFETFQLNGIAEECEYDSDIGKFNCRIETVSDNSSGSFDFVDGCASLNTPTFTELSDNKVNIESNGTGCLGGEKKIVMKRIEFFEGNSGGHSLHRELETLSAAVRCDEDSKTLSSLLCLGGFFLTALILYLFPLPN